MAKLTITHEMEIDCGDIPPYALAEYLKRADEDESNWTIWEVTMNGSIKLTSVEVAD